MKNTGIIRKIDELGRVVIPKETRNLLRINSGDDLEIYVDSDSIILKKFFVFNNNISSINRIIEIFQSKVNGTILFCDKEKVISSNVRINLFLEELLKERCCYESKNIENIIPDKIGYYYIRPIIQNSNANGLLIFVSDKLTNEDKLLIDLLQLIIENS